MSCQDCDEDDEDFCEYFCGKLDTTAVTPATEEQAVKINFEDIEKLVLSHYPDQEGDLHKRRAAAMFGVPYEGVTNAQRVYAKQWYLVKNYGGTVSGLLAIRRNILGLNKAE